MAGSQSSFPERRLVRGWGGGGQTPHGGAFVADGIDPCLCSVSYASVEDAANAVVQLGRGVMMAKFDLESAYHILPVHPQDRLLLDMQWKGATYVDGALPFGLR